MNSEDVLDAMQDLMLRDGQPPSIQAIARALGRTKQAVLHYFPDREAFERALAARALARVDAAMSLLPARGEAAATYLRLSVPTGGDQAVGVAWCSPRLRTRAPLPRDSTPRSTVGGAHRRRARQPGAGRGRPARRRRVVRGVPLREPRRRSGSRPRRPPPRSGRRSRQPR